MSRKNILRDFACHFVSNAPLYMEWYPTLSDAARAIGCTSAALRRRIAVNPVPGIRVYLGVVYHRGRYLPAYRFAVDDLDTAVAYLKEVCCNG